MDKTSIDPMALEIEQKYRVSRTRIADIERRLKSAGANKEGRDFEENTIYGGGTLDQQPAILRIRVTDNKAIFTFKRRIEDVSDIKRQIEIESEFSDPTALKEILKLLGFIPRLIYEKRRETWTLGHVEVVLDELPFGLFMEIEGEPEAIRRAEILLKILDLETVHETYPQMTVQFGRNKESVIEARFDQT